MQRLTLTKVRQIKYLFTLLLNGVFILVLGVDLTFLKRVISDLMMKGLSLNQTQEHMKLIYNIQMSHASIQTIQTEAGQKARHLNATFDKRVAPKISKIEVDEVFQGKNTVTLGAVAKTTNYLLGLSWSPNRTKEALIAFLRPLAKQFTNIRVGPFLILEDQF